MNFADILPVVQKYESELVNFRQRLHQFPELAYKEFKTAEAVLDRLSVLSDVSIESGIATTGIKVILKGGRPGPTIALRADMDALPIDEETGVSYSSANKGVMHACGHDGHTTCLLGALLVLHELRNSLPGTVVFLFQPAEELEFGALRMIEQGVLKAPAVQAIFAAHAWPEIPVGLVAATAGPVMAGFRDFDIKVSGRGAHAAMPEKGVDPIVISAQIISALQTVVSRSVSPAEQLVVTVGRIHGGRGRNVIPDSVTFGGTTRFYSQSVGDAARSRIEGICTSIAASFGGGVEIEWFEGAPPVVNDSATTGYFSEIAAELSEGAVFEPAMAAEDFAFYLDGIPGVFWGLGIGGEGVRPLHHPEFDFADEAIVTGVGVHCMLALNATSLTL